MKQTVTYIMGTLLLLPCLLMFTDSLSVDIFAFVYTLLVLISPQYSQKAKRFWRVWHRENIRIISSIK